MAVAFGLADGDGDAEALGAGDGEAVGGLPEDDDDAPEYDGDADTVVFGNVGATDCEPLMTVVVLLPLYVSDITGPFGAAVGMCNSPAISPHGWPRRRRRL